MEFNESEPVIDPLLHVLCLVWANCKDYRHPERIVVLLQEICNLVINCVRASMRDGSHLTIGLRAVPSLSGPERDLQRRSRRVSSESRDVSEDPQPIQGVLSNALAQAIGVLQGRH